MKRPQQPHPLLNASQQTIGWIDGHTDNNQFGGTTFFGRNTKGQQLELATNANGHAVDSHGRAMTSFSHSPWHQAAMAATGKSLQPQTSPSQPSWQQSGVASATAAYQQPASSQPAPPQSTHRAPSIGGGHS